MSDKLSELSKAEWVLMKIFWQSEKLTARQVHEQATLKKKWEYQTVKTMLDRLVAKGYLKRKKIGPVYLYESIVTRSKVVCQAIESFVSTTLDNTVMPLFVHFVKKGKLSEDELNSLKKLIEECEENV